jgi:preprotein translocase subunit Sss1
VPITADDLQLALKVALAVAAVTVVVGVVGFLINLAAKRAEHTPR